MLPYFKTGETLVNVCLKCYTRQNKPEDKHALNENCFFVLCQLFKYFTVFEKYHFLGEVYEN